MSDRRAARAGSAPAATRSGELPADMAMGPCIEVWADRPGGTPTSPPWMRARRAWAQAVAEWAVTTGWATDRRPAMNARNMARIRHPWSKAFLLSRGEGEFVAYLEGRRADNPGRSEPPWQLS